MRFLRILSITVILFNSLYPCADFGHTEQAQNISAIQNIEADDCMVNEIDLCSPLCTCACCAASPVVESLRIAKYYPVALPFIPHIKDSKTKPHIPLIDQPPRS